MPMNQSRCICHSKPHMRRDTRGGWQVECACGRRTNRYVLYRTKDEATYAWNRLICKERGDEKRGISAGDA